MTAFGKLLRFYRTQRGLTQSELASKISDSINRQRVRKFDLYGSRTLTTLQGISNVEKGRRQPPMGPVLTVLFDALELSSFERRQLIEARARSSFAIQVPRTASPADLELVHYLVSSLPALSDDRKTQIANLIGFRRETIG